MNGRTLTLNCRTLALAAVLGMIASISHAQVERSGNADARVMQQLQQLTSERVALQAENAKLKQELEQVKKDLQLASSAKATLENRTRALEASASRDSGASKQAEEQLERSRAQTQEVIAKYREMAQTLRDVETDRATAKGQLAMRERELKTCVDRNAGLYNLNEEVLARMEKRGFWSNVAEREPFTQLKRVELENLIDDYKYRAEELRMEQQKQVQAAQAKE